MNQDEILQGLLVYCQLGWRLLPLWSRDENGLCGCMNEGCTNKHPRIKWQNPDLSKGQTGASCDPEVVASWVMQWPLSDWAMVLDDLFVVDIDVKHGGMETLTRVDEENPGLLWPTLCQETPSGGRQYIYRQPDEKDIVTLKQGMLKGLNGWEIKGLKVKGGSGHYVGIPPSMGRKWIDKRMPSEATSDLLDVIRRSTVAGAYRASTLGDVMIGDRFDWEAALTYGAVMSGQDDVLFRAACSLRAMKVPDGFAVTVLRCVVRCFVNVDERDPWHEQRADDKWESVKRYESGVSSSYTGSDKHKEIMKRLMTRAQPSVDTSDVELDSPRITQVGRKYIVKNEVNLRRTW